MNALRPLVVAGSVSLASAFRPKLVHYARSSSPVKTRFARLLTGAAAFGRLGKELGRTRKGKAFRESSGDSVVDSYRRRRALAAI